MIEICQQEPYLSEDKLAVIEAAKDRGLVVFDFTEAVGRILTLDLDTCVASSWRSSNP